MEIKRQDTEGTMVLFMSLHAMFTVFLLVGMIHTQIRMASMTEHVAKQEGEIIALRDKINYLVHVGTSNKEQKSIAETKDEEDFDYKAIEPKDKLAAEKDGEGEEEVDAKPLILRTKRATKTKCCEKGSRGRKGQKGDRGRRGRRGAKGGGGIKGDKGDDGGDGQVGQPGAKGDKGNKGEMGNTGVDGRDGRFGPPGQRGAKGAKGETGVTGRDGRDGKDGQQGIRGPKGEKGEKGVPGTRVMFPESAHIVGQGGKKQLRNVLPNSDVYLLTSWAIKHTKGQMSYSHGYLRVGIEGYYYIYSQIYYRDGRSPVTGYVIYIDDKPVIEALNSVINSLRRFNTNYIGGVFHINAGQKISIRTVYRQIFYFDSKKSYFGAFMIHS